MTKISSRSHNVTLGVVFIIACVIMLLFLFHKTHEKLELSRKAYIQLDDKYATLLKQFESLFEYKERLEASFMELKETKTSMASHSDTLKSELAVLKSSHKTEIQRLHDELDSCRRREETALIQRSQKEDAAVISPSFGAQNPSMPISPVEETPKAKSDDIGGIKVISNLALHHSNSPGKDKNPAPSMDPNQDLAGNIIV